MVFEKQLYISRTFFISLFLLVIKRYSEMDTFFLYLCFNNLKHNVMAWKVWKVGSYLYLEDTATNELIDGAASRFEFRKKRSTDTFYELFYDGNRERAIPFDISDLQDQSGTPFTDETFELFKEANTGFNVATSESVNAVAIDLSTHEDNETSFHGITMTDGVIDPSHLPSYVDDVIEVVDYASLPGIGEGGKIYITINDNKQYRWSGSVYVELNNFVAGIAYNPSTTIFSGGLITGDGTPTFSVSAGTGATTLYDINSVETYTPFTITPVTNVTPLYARTIIYVDSTGTVGQFNATAGDLSPLQRRQLAILGGFIYAGGLVQGLQNLPISSVNLGASFDELSQGIGAMNVSGNVIYSNGANLLINKSLGNTYRNLSNAAISKNVLHTTTDSAQIPLSAGSRLAYRNGTGGWTYVPFTGILPDLYDDGSGTPAAVGNNKWTTHRVYFFNLSNVCIVYLGQTQHLSKDAAIAAVNNNTRVVDVTTSTGLLRGSIVVEKGATTLANAGFLPGDKFGGSSSGAGVGTTNLQGAFDNSTDPEIAIPVGKDFSLKSATGNDADTIFNTKNNAGTETSRVTVNGNAFFNNIGVNHTPPTGDSNTVTNTTSEVNFTGTGYQFTSDPTRMRVGTRIHLRAFVRNSAATSPNLNIRAKAGVAGTSTLNSCARTQTGNTNAGGTIEMEVRILSLGVPGTCVCSLNTLFSEGSGAYADGQMVSSNGTKVINTTVANVFGLSAQYSAANTSNNITIEDVIWNIKY